MDNRPIGIFDSGVGGLTVVKAVKKLLPNESIVYFGDTARVPYGSKSKETVTKFSSQIIRFLKEQDVKAIIIACNTVNSNSINELREMFPDIPISGVVEPGVSMALRTTTTGRIGIIGTEATISSGRYPKLLKKENDNLKVYGKACPLFVPLVEEDWVNHHVTKDVAKEYLEPLLNNNIDTLILGCTHYPMLTSVIGEIVGEGVRLINPAKEAARRLDAYLHKEDMRGVGIGQYKFYVSDNVNKFKKIAKMFLNHDVESIEGVDIEQY